MNKYFRLLRYDWPMHFVLLFTNWLPDNVVFLKFRGLLASRFFRKCGKNLTIGRNVVFYNPSLMEIGNDNYIAYGNWFVTGGKIIIGDKNLFGPYSIFVAGNHVFDGISYFNEQSAVKDIIIGDGNWIAGHCVI